MNEKEFKRFKVGDLVEVEGRSISYGGKREDRVVGYIGYTRARGGYEGGGCIPRIDLKVHTYSMYGGYRHTVYFNVHDIASMRKINKGEIKMNTMTVKQVVHMLVTDDFGDESIVMSRIKHYTCMLARVATGYLDEIYPSFAFLPASSLLCPITNGIHSFGVSPSEENGLKHYLEIMLEDGYDMYYAYSLGELIDGKCSKVILDKKHTIKIDGKDIEISDKSFINLKKSLIK